MQGGNHQLQYSRGSNRGLALTLITCHNTTPRKADGGRAASCSSGGDATGDEAAAAHEQEVGVKGSHTSKVLVR